MLVSEAEPADVRVVNPAYWAARPEQLAQLLGRSTAGHVIPDPQGAPAVADGLLAVVDPAFWSAHLQDLSDALRALTTDTGASMAPTHAAGAVAPSAERLTLTVEEAAALLGISRAFAYEAVRRGEIPSIRIGRRVLVPRVALDRLVNGPEVGPDTQPEEP